MKRLLKFLPDRLDAAFFLGSAAVVFGVYQLNHALAWIVGGVIVMRMSWLASARPRTEQP